MSDSHRRLWLQAEHKKRSKARKESQKPTSRFEEEPSKGGLLNKYDEEEEEAAMLIGEQGDLFRRDLCLVASGVCYP